MKISLGIHALESPKRGGALVVSLILVTTIAALGAGVVRVQTSMARRHMNSVEMKRALYVAEAGISEAFFAIAVGQSGNVGTVDKPAKWGDGVYWVEAEEDAEGNITLDSNGLCGQGRFSISAVVRRGVNLAAAGGVCGASSITIGEGAIIDGYCSFDGSYASQVDPMLPGNTTGRGGRITTNGDANLLGDLIPPPVGGPGAGLQPETFVYGDVLPGPKGTVMSEPGVLISGSTAPADEETELPGIAVPDLPNSEGTVNTSGLTLSGDELRYDHLGVAPGATLRLEGPMKLVIDTFEVDGRVEIDASTGPVTIYVTYALHFKAGSQLDTVSEDPTQIGFFLGNLGDDDFKFTELEKKLAEGLEGGEGKLGAGMVKAPAAPALTFRPTGTYHGLIFAPFCDFELPASLRVFGAISGKTITLAPGARFTVDESLVNASLGMEVLPQIVSWRIIDLPDEALVKRRIDPLLQLAALGVTPDKSCDAHEEVVFAIKYYDAARVPQYYLGPVAVFDWTDVSGVSQVQWEDPGTGTLSKPSIPAGVVNSSGEGYFVLDDDGAGGVVLK